MERGNERHGSSLRRLLAGGTLGAQGFLLAPQGSLDAMRLVLRQDVRPLGNSRRCEFTRPRGSGYGSTQQVDRGFLVHAPDFSALKLESKPPKCEQRSNKATMKTLSERIGAALAAGFTRAQLADAAKKTGAAVSHWQSGLVKSLKADSAAGLAKLTGWNVDWWISGKGPQFSEIPSSAVRSYSDTNLVRAPVVEWARLGEDLYKDTSELSGGESLDFVPMTEHGERVKLIKVMDDSLAPRLVAGDIVAIDPDNTSPARGQVALFRSAADGGYFLRRYQPLMAPHFEAVDARGNVLDSQRHGLEVVGVRCGCILSDI